MATTAIAGATLAPSDAQRPHRLQTVVRFARFMAAEDPRHEIPPAGRFYGRRQRPTPDILSDAEIEPLRVYAGRRGPPGALRPQTYRTLFGWLAITGMRVAEARALHLTDITADGVLIRDAKFHKSRVLPRHGTTRAALERYRGARCRSAGADPHLFVTRRGRQLSHTVVAETCHQVLTAAEVPRAPGRRRPRLMDLRHTVAVRALERCPETRDAIGRQTLALTTSRGHACVSSTYWSLDSTPQLMTDMARSCATCMSGGGA